MPETIHSIFYKELADAGRLNSEQVARAAYSRVMQAINKEPNRRLLNIKDSEGVLDFQREIAEERIPTVRSIVKAALSNN